MFKRTFLLLVFACFAVSAAFLRNSTIREPVTLAIGTGAFPRLNRCLEIRPPDSDSKAASSGIEMRSPG
jgi:hypothetical protein